MTKGSGLAHWRAQRATAILLVPLSLWFAYSMVSLTGQPYQVVHTWASGGVNAFLMVVFLVALFRHAQLGVEEIIEDYVHGPCVKYGSLMAVRATALGLFGLALLSIILIVIGV